MQFCNPLVLWRSCKNVEVQLDSGARGQGPEPKATKFSVSESRDRDPERVPGQRNACKMTKQYCNVEPGVFKHVLVCMFIPT